MYSVRCKLYILQCTVYHKECIVNSKQHTMDKMKVYNVLRTLYSRAQCRDLNTKTVRSRTNADREILDTHLLTVQLTV